MGYCVCEELRVYSVALSSAAVSALIRDFMAHAVSSAYATKLTSINPATLSAHGADSVLQGSTHTGRWCNQGPARGPLISPSLCLLLSQVKLVLTGFVAVLCEPYKHIVNYILH